MVMIMEIIIRIRMMAVMTDTEMMMMSLWRPFPLNETLSGRLSSPVVGGVYRHLTHTSETQLTMSRLRCVKTAYT